MEPWHEFTKATDFDQEKNKISSKIKSLCYCLQTSVSASVNKTVDDQLIFNPLQRGPEDKVVVHDRLHTENIFLVIAILASTSFYGNKMNKSKN